MTNLKPLALGTLILAAPTLAISQIAVGDTLGTSDTAIQAAVEAAGYSIEEIEREEDGIEVEVMINGVETTLLLTAETGQVSMIEVDDDDEDDDDDDEDDEDDDDEEEDEDEEDDDDEDEDDDD